MEESYIGTRIETETKKTIHRVCNHRSEAISDFIRRSVKKELASLGYLSAEEMKALGVKPQEEYC